MTDASKQKFVEMRNDDGATWRKVVVVDFEKLTVDDKDRCWFFQTGMCENGDNCSYVHDNEIRATPPECRYWTSGNCRFGNKCRYRHSDQQVPEPETVEQEVVQESDDQESDGDNDETNNPFDALAEM